MAKDFEVIVTDPERAAFFQEVFGRTTINVLSPVPMWAGLPGLGSSLVFMMDLKLISDAELARLVEHLARRFNLPIEEVAREVERTGVPILDKDCTVVVSNLQRWV